MKTIHKFALQPGINDISMPQRAIILHVGVQRGTVCVWAQVDVSPDTLFETRRMVLYGTGHALADNPGTYIGTVMVLNAELVFHAYLEA